MPTAPADRLARILSGPTPLSVGGANPAENLSVLVGRNAAGKVGVWVINNRHPTQPTRSVSQTTRTPPMHDDAKTTGNTAPGARSREVIHKPTAPSTTTVNTSLPVENRDQEPEPPAHTTPTGRLTMRAMRYLLDAGHAWTTAGEIRRTAKLPRTPTSTLAALEREGYVEDDTHADQGFTSQCWRLTARGVEATTRGGEGAKQ